MLASCSSSSNSLVDSSNRVINGVVEIINIPDDVPKPQPSPSPSSSPTPGPTPNLPHRPDQPSSPSPSPLPSPSPSPSTSPYPGWPTPPTPQVQPSPIPSQQPHLESYKTNIHDYSPDPSPPAAKPTPTPAHSPTPDAKKTPAPNDDEDDDDDDDTPTTPPKPKKPQGPDIGTGFIIAPNLIVTNYHVIEGDKRHYEIIGHNDLKHYVGHVIAGDKASDLAILKIDDWDDFVNTVHPPTLKWGDSRKLQQGQHVWAIGHPYGLTWSITSGIVSNILRHNFEDLGPNTFYMQTDASINPGNSGGPLFNDNSEIIGVNSAIYGTKGFVGLSIPSNYARKIVEDLQNGGKVKPAMIGINMAISPDKHHIAIGQLILGINSIDSGLLPNDKILQIKTLKTNGWVNINSSEELQFETKLLRPGDSISLYVLRDNNQYLTFNFNMSEIK